MSNHLKSNQIKINIIKLVLGCILIIILSLTFHHALATKINWFKAESSQSPNPQAPWKFMYNPPTADLILFGGNSPEGNYKTMWKYDLEENAWSIVEIPDWEIFPKMGWDMAYDSKNDIYITFGGGSTGGTWVFNYTSKIWTNMTPSVSPPNRIFSNLVYDTQSEKIIMYGGLSQFFAPNFFFHDTWSYDYLTNTWINVTPSISPEARAKADMVYDSSNDKILLFGGFTEKPDDYVIAGHKKDLWAFDLETTSWVELTPSTSPPARAYHSMVYDSICKQTVLFGGDFSNFDPASDTWIYNYTTNTWSELIFDKKPHARWTTGMVFNPKTDQIILFGGQIAEGMISSSFVGDTWILGANITNNTTGINTISLGLGVLVILLRTYYYRRRVNKT